MAVFRIVLLLVFVVNKGSIWKNAVWTEWSCLELLTEQISTILAQKIDLFHVSILIFAVISATSSRAGATEDTF